MMASQTIPSNLLSKDEKRRGVVTVEEIYDKAANKINALGGSSNTEATETSTTTGKPRFVTLVSNPQTLLTMFLNNSY